MSIITNNDNKKDSKDPVNKIAVGLSGGVDSSVTAYLLKEQGFDVTGVYMQCWDARADGCTADADRADAVAVSTKLGIKFEHLDFIKEYKEKVIEHFYKEYEEGRTPNPDIICNRDIKFGMFMDWAMGSGFSKIATGHYARIKETEKGYQLLKGVDETKDQSYFLYLLTQEQLSRSLFPIGGMYKMDVRELAKKAGLHTYDKPDSVGICFIGEVDIEEFLKKRLKEVPGDVVSTTGEVIGSHKGIHFYTIGQRRGFDITKYTGLPLYVVGKDKERNRLIVGFAGDVNQTEFFVRDPHWIVEEPKGELEVDVRVRHLGDIHRGRIVIDKENTVQVVLDEPVFGVAPGQSAVFYKGDVVLGGGVIQ
jgi:tRNA-uridine 2-sulfurtransferase